MRIGLNTVSAQGVKSLGHDNNAGIVMPFRVYILLKRWSKHFLLIIFTEKIMIAIHGRAWHFMRVSHKISSFLEFVGILYNLSSE